MERERDAALIVKRKIEGIKTLLNNTDKDATLRERLDSQFGGILTKAYDRLTIRGDIESSDEEVDDEGFRKPKRIRTIRRKSDKKTSEGEDFPNLFYRLDAFKKNIVHQLSESEVINFPTVNLEKLSPEKVQMNLDRQRLASLDNGSRDYANTDTSDDDLFDEVSVKRKKKPVIKESNGFNTNNLPEKRIRKQIVRPDFVSNFKKIKMDREDMKMEIKQEDQACSSNEGDSTSNNMSNGNGVEFPCPVCKKIFRKKGHMTRHLLTHEPEKPFGCDFCSKRFAAKYSLQMHLLNRHNTDAKPFECDHCDKRFTLKKELDQHKATHKEGYKPRSYPCHLCELKFMNKDDLDSHLETHPEANVYHCAHCDKSFPRKYNLTRHERTHSTDKPYHCDVCNKDFGTKNGLHMHLQAHEADDNKPLTCHLCNKRFTVEQNLELHLSFHNQSDEKPYSCDLCEVRFKSQERLEKHFETHGSSEGRVYPCQYCDKTFPRKYNLIRHELSHTHGRRKPKDGMPTSRFSYRNGDDDDSDDENMMIGTGGDENSVVSHDSESMQENNRYVGFNSLSKSEMYLTLFGVEDIVSELDEPPSERYSVIKFENY